MNYKYTIHETHTNSKNDWSEVTLHDASTDPMYYDGADFIIPLPDGFIVRPNGCCNDTDRFLQTGAGEIRLKNAACLTEFVPFDKTYDILDHRYNPAENIYALLLESDFSRRSRYVDFRCSSVEYRFSDFVGDSWLQRAKDQKQEIFRRFLCQGRGEAVHMLRRSWMDDDGRHEFLDAVIHAVTHDLRLDHQCNADRTQYIFDLLESYSGEDREILNRAILHGHWQEAAESYDYFEFVQYLNVLKHFTETGEPAAEETIRQMYETIRKAYETRTEVPEPYDLLGQKYCMISRFIGKPLPDDDEDRHVPHPRPAEPLQTIDRIIEFTRNPDGKTVHPARFCQFFRKKAAPDDIKKLAEAAKKETDPDTKARLYSLFGETNYPGDPAELIDLAKEYEPMLHSHYGQESITAFKLQHALSRLHHPAVRAYGFELLERAREREDSSRYIYGFEHWAANYDEQTDLDSFCDLLLNLPEWMDEDNRHTLEFNIVHDMFTRRYEDPRTYGHLVWVYENTYCSCCRRSAVEILAKHGMLQKRIREQCLFDCDLRTREIAEKADVI